MLPKERAARVSNGSGSKSASACCGRAAWPRAPVHPWLQRGPTDNSASVRDVMTGASGGPKQLASWPTGQLVEVSRTPRGDATVISEDR